MFTINDLEILRNEYDEFYEKWKVCGGIPKAILYVLVEQTDQYAYEKLGIDNYKQIELDVNESLYKTIKIPLVEDLKRWYAKRGNKKKYIDARYIDTRKWQLNDVLIAMQYKRKNSKNIQISKEQGEEEIYFKECAPIDPEEIKAKYDYVLGDKVKAAEDERAEAENSINVDNEPETTKPLSDHDIHDVQISQICAETAKALIKDSDKKTVDLLGDKAKKYSGLEKAIQKYAAQFVERHNRLKIIGMTEPTTLDSIYVNVNILEEITCWQYHSREELEAWEEHFRKHKSFGKISEKSVDGLELANRKQFVMLLGQPGGGKTTFLKQIGLQAIQDKLKDKRIPVFITLKELADRKCGLLDFILLEFEACGFPDAQSFIEKQLQEGKFFLLLDGLDEVNKDCIAGVYNDVNRFCDQHSENQFLISCRTAAYNQNFPRFIDVELADFNEKQIEQFIKKWFRENQEKSTECWKKLKTDRQHMEIAQTPLLLALFCLAFDESMDFPQNRSMLYKRAINALLEKWDSTRNIKRDEIYKQLPTERKEQMLSQIAAQTFQEEQYFILTSELVKQIESFIVNLTDSPPQGKIVLKEIEKQHGILVERSHDIHSFAHLTFQEYLTARYIVDRAAKRTLEKLMEHLTEYRWREVFLLTAGLLPPLVADDFLLLMKKKADSLIKDEKLVKFFSWAKEKADSVQADYNPWAIRIYYIHQIIINSYFDRARALARDFALDLDLVLDLTRASARALALVLDRALALVLDRALDRDRNRNCDQLILSACKQAKEIGAISLQKSLEKLSSQTPKDNDSRQLWEFWAEKLQKIVIKERNIGHDWGFSTEQIDCMSNYFSANKLIADCMNCGSYVTKSVREEIENTLLLPFG